MPTWLPTLREAAPLRRPLVFIATEAVDTESPFTTPESVTAPATNDDPYTVLPVAMLAVKALVFMVQLVAPPANIPKLLFTNDKPLA